MTGDGNIQRESVDLRYSVRMVMMDAGRMMVRTEAFVLGTHSPFAGWICL